MPAQRATTEPAGEEPLGAWNPGLESALPRAFLPLASLFRPESAVRPFAEIEEVGGFSGLPLQEVVAFRTERLVVHEVLIRVMADLSVPMGETYGDLGVNFRAIVSTILDTYLAPHAAAIAEAHDAVRAEAADMLEREVAAILAPAAPAAAAPKAGGWRVWLGLSGPKPAAPPRRESLEDRALAHLASWRARADRAANEAEICASAALTRVVSAVIRQRGRLIGDAKLLAGLAGTLVGNDHGSRVVGRLIEPWFEEAAAREGYHRIRAQAHPIVMNVKGSSASGKSTMRPLQRALAERIGVPWSDFAVITPDIWRKFLLDYDALGPATRYAGTLTGHEVEIVDRKLDRYMARKAGEGRMSHLLIDRFRFDSFAADSDTQDGSQLLTRFGQTVYMLFMITPPDATVERAWKRGELFGRYKAVDDLLAHNVEAYTGMPGLFFTWALKADKHVQYEFLDNSVRLGQRPRTVAFGADGTLTILDLARILDIDRFRKINIEAQAPEAVYPDAGAMAPERNTDFLRQCARRLSCVRFAEQATGRVYARLEGGRLVCLDRAVFARMLADPDTRAAFAALGANPPDAGAEPDLDRADTHTLGAWGGED